MHLLEIEFHPAYIITPEFWICKVWEALITKFSYFLLRFRLLLQEFLRLKEHF